MKILALTAAVFFAQSNPLGTPTGDEFFTWMKVAIGVLIIVALVKNIFGKTPPDHQRWADKTETSERLTKIEDKLEELETKVVETPSKTIALMHEANRLFQR